MTVLHTSYTCQYLLEIFVSEVLVKLVKQFSNCIIILHCLNTICQHYGEILDCDLVRILAILQGCCQHFVTFSHV